jgi:hypothetical protein
MKTFIRVSIFLVLCFGIFAVAIIGSIHEYKESENEWNEGICTHCGEGEYHLLNIEHFKNLGDKYYFVCDNCGASIALNHNPNNK